MADNRHLVPVCIIYLDGTRLSLVHEGALRSVTVLDRLNGASWTFISFTLGELTPSDLQTFGFDSEISVHMGYKDDTKEVFSGFIASVKKRLPEYGTGELEVGAANGLQRLEHGKRDRRFEKKSRSGAVKEVLEYYGLKAEVESFGREIPYWEGGFRTDMDLVRELAGQYGKDFYGWGEKAYVAEQMKVRTDEVIYEWGKSLIRFRGRESSRGQLRKSRYIGWDPMMEKGFQGSKKIGEVNQKVGGGKDWTAAGKGGLGVMGRIHCGLQHCGPDGSGRPGDGAAAKTELWVCEGGRGRGG